MTRPLLMALALLMSAGAALATPPSVPAIDAPALAALGPFAVGFESLTLTQPGQADVLNPDRARHLPTAWLWSPRQWARFRHC